MVHRHPFEDPALQQFKHYPVDRTLHQLFEEVVQRHPDNIALVDEHSTLTFRELNLKANAVAAEILGRGVVPGSFVGICLDRSSSVVISILATLKAGCAWIPLDPSNPPDRLRFVIEDASIAITITREPFREKLPDSHSVLKNPDEVPVTLSGSIGNPGLPCDPSNTAYVIYTSGSTGQPKGVCCHHRGVINLLDDFQSRQPVAGGDRCSWWSNLSFDVSVYELFTPLIAGAALVVVPEDVRHDVALLMEWLDVNGVTSAFLPPMMVADYDAWIREHPGKSLLRRLLTGVESLPEKLLLDIGASVPGLIVINGYGPTETTVCATLYTVTPNGNARKDTPVGQPVQNMHIHLLDEEDNEVAPGETGEICICGVGVSNGYLNRPELAARLFVSDPCSKERHLPMYLSGDLGYLLADGNIMFAGRKDFQFKHMGYRIEPGEIEAVLRSHEAVREAVVMLREVQPGLNHLVGYVTRKENAGVTPSQLDAFLRQVLPAHMVPVAFVVLDVVPMTANGKTDRKAMPLPVRADFPGGKEGGLDAYETLGEREVAGFFSALLGVAGIGADDDFFSLGGNSLLATRLASRIRERWGVALPLETIFRNPTVRAIAAASGGEQSEGAFERIPVNNPKRAIFPAGWLQKGMWLLQQLQAEGTLLNIPVIVTIEGALDTGALRKSFAYLVERHECLRSTFVVEGEELLQRVSSSIELPWMERDISGLDKAVADSILDATAKEEGVHVFTPDQGPLFRILLVRMATQSYRLFLTISHLIIDGWSAALLFREWTGCYDALTKGDALALPELSPTYSDFALWQQQRSTGAAMEKRIASRVERLREWPGHQELPSDYPRPPVQSYSGARHVVRFTPERSAAIRDYCVRNACTPYMFLMAVFQVLLHRWSGRNSIITGTTIANRNHPETEHMVGLFVNNLAIVTDFSGHPAFRDILDQVRDYSLEAFDHQDVPFGLVADRVTALRDRSRHPVFQNLFILQNTPEPVFRAGDVRFEYEEVGNGTAKLDLLLNLEFRNGICTGWMEYNTDLFRSTTIERLANDFIWIAGEALSGTGTEVGCWKLPSVPVIRELARGDEELVPCCHRLFELQVAAEPERIAVQYGDRCLTCREVDEQANRLAHHLIGMGVGPDVAVGLCMERSPELVIALLGILKAGAAYVPVDPSYPDDRIRFMAEDSGMALVLADTLSAPRLAVAVAVEIVVLDGMNASLQALSAETPLLRTVPEHLAYIMYTSGSTGTPKGVMVTHGGVTSLARSAVSRYSISRDDRVLQFFSISFDGSVEELFMSFASGATLVLRNFPVEVSAQEFFSQIERQRVTVLDLPTAFWHELVAALKSGSTPVPPLLRLLIIGGEQALFDDYRAWKQLTGGRVRLLNTYGPTECTVVSLVFDPESAAGMVPDDVQAVPIGFPMENTSIAVVSEGMAMMPFGMPGELLIGGAGVAGGYLNRPELTQSRFISENLCAGMLRGRFYRSGDRVRYLENGALQFLGRLDNQVKIRGFRIEPGEIEAALNRHPQVRSSAVIDLRNKAGRTFLAGFIIPEGQAPSGSELRRFLLQTLPEYMVPLHFKAMEAFPQLPNGKIDRQAFPDPEEDGGSNAPHSVAPRTGLERALVDVWEEVLGVHPVGINDDFFSLGGHSLLAVRLCSRMQEATGSHISLSGLFRNLTIEALAASLEQDAMPVNTTCAVTMQSASAYSLYPPLFIIHVLGTGLKFCRPLVRHLGSDITVYALSVHLLDEPPISAWSVEELARYYVQEVRKIQPHGPCCFAGISFGGMVAVEMARIMSNENDDVRLVALLDSILITAFRRLDTSGRVKGHREMIREQGVGYLVRKAKERFRGEFTNLSEKVEILLLSLRLRYYKARQRTAIMPVELKEFAARQENDDAWRNYRPAPFSGKVTLFRSSDQSFGVSEVLDPLLGWESVAADLEVIDCPGDHLSMLYEPQVNTLALRLRESIEKASGRIVIRGGTSG